VRPPERQATRPYVTSASRAPVRRTAVEGPQCVDPPRFQGEGGKVRNRRILLVAVRSGKGLLSERRAALSFGGGTALLAPFAVASGGAQVITH